MSTPPDRVPLNALRVFEAVAAHLSFTAAARELGVTTAAVSAQIKALEADIGVPLFRRHTRAVALTQEGAELLPGVRRGLEELRRSVERIRRERVGGMLNLSVPNEFLQRWLLPRLGEFTRRHPEIEVRFGPPRAAGLDFGRDDFHAAIVYGPGQWTGLKAERLLDEYVFPVCSPVLLARFGPIETVADFARYPLIHSRTEPWQDWLRRVGGDTTRNRLQPADGRFRGVPRRGRTGQRRCTGSLVAGSGRHRRRSPGTSDAPKCAAAKCLVPCGPSSELFITESRAIPRLAARLLPRVLPPVGETLGVE